MIKTLMNMISNHNDLPAIVFSLVKKAFTHHGGALVILSAPGAFGVREFVAMILEGTKLRDLVMPLTLFALLMLAYVIVSMVDFYTGISASKKEHIISTGSPRGYIQSDKLWSSVWKFLGVLLIASILTLFTLVFAIMSMSSLYNVFLMGIVFFYLSVILFDLHSIGENQFRRYGHKPKIYVLLDRASTVIQDGFLKKIGKLFE